MYTLLLLILNMASKKKATGTEPPGKRRQIQALAVNFNSDTTSSDVIQSFNLNSDTTSSDVIQSLTKNITSNILAELQKVGVLPKHKNGTWRRCRQSKPEGSFQSY